jgi:hypothetical protein
LSTHPAVEEAQVPYQPPPDFSHHQQAQADQIKRAQEAQQKQWEQAERQRLAREAEQRQREMEAAQRAQQNRTSQRF